MSLDQQPTNSRAGVIELNLEMKTQVAKIKSRRTSVAVEVEELRRKHDRKSAIKEAGENSAIAPSSPQYQVLGSLCAQRRSEEGLSLRDVATATGIAAATLMRMEHGRRANAENVIALSRWLNVPIETVNHSLPEDVPRAVHAIVYNDPRLSKEQRKSLCYVFGILYRQMTNGVPKS